MRRSLTCLMILLVTIPLGLAARYTHLPWFFSKYLGSMFWAATLYWFVGIFLPQCAPLAPAVIASAASVLVELSRLLPEPHIDAFRLTLAGKLLLGRYFSVWNIVAYLAAIALTAMADHHFRPGRNAA